MQQLDKDREYWFVLGSKSVNREMKICNDMRLQHLECFVPLKYEVRRVRNLKEEKLVPAIRGLIFAKATEDRLTDYILRSKDGLFFRRAAFSDNPEQRDKLIVNDREMATFMEFVKATEQHVRFYKPEEITWVEGEIVRVTIGSKTYEGEIVRVKGKKLFSLRLHNSLFATVTLTPDLLESAEGCTTEGRKKRSVKYEDRDVRKSKDPEGDKKLLTDTAKRLLFEPYDDTYINQRARQLMQKEVERVMKRLSPYKGVTAALEGELALAMFLGAAAIDGDTEAAAERMKRAIDKLADTSMLKLRMRCYLAKLTNDEAEITRIAETVKTWDHHHLQRKQQELMNEMNETIWQHSN